MNKTKKKAKKLHKFQLVDITQFNNAPFYTFTLKMLGVSPASSLFIRLYNITVHAGEIDKEMVVKFKNHSIEPIILKGFTFDNKMYLNDELGLLGPFKITLQNT